MAQLDFTLVTLKQSLRSLIFQIVTENTFSVTILILGHTSAHYLYGVFCSVGELISI